MSKSAVTPIATHIAIIDGQLTTTTQDIADVYGKQHVHVLRIVRQRMEEAGEWGVSNFGDTPYTNPQNGQTYPVIRMTEKGFMFVVGKFTGAKAVQHQIAFVDEFERMKAELAKESQRSQMPVVQQQPDLDTINRINKRAWNLAQASFEEYRTRMMEDVLVKTGCTKPEDWQPVETSKEMIEMILATLNGLESMTKSLRKKAAQEGGALGICGKSWQSGVSWRFRVAKKSAPTTQAQTEHLICRAGTKESEMKIGGIVVLAVCAIGIYSVLKWVFVHVRALFGKQQPGQQQKKKYIRIGHEQKLVCFDDLPEANKYKGRTWLGGLPVYADIVVPDKHDYSTIIYMDHWFKQAVYDWMSSWKTVANDEDNPYGGRALLGCLALPFFFNVDLGVALLVIAALFFAFGAPSGNRAVRRMGENAKDFTPETWAKIYDDVVKDLAEEERLVSAMRRSGTHWRWPGP